MKALKPRLHWNYACKALNCMKDVEAGVIDTMMHALNYFGEHCPNENYELGTLMNLRQDLRCTSKPSRLSEFNHVGILVIDFLEKLMLYPNVQVNSRRYSIQAKKILQRFGIKVQYNHTFRKEDQTN